MYYLKGIVAYSLREANPHERLRKMLAYDKGTLTATRPIRTALSCGRKLVAEMKCERFSPELWKKNAITIVSARRIP